MARSWKISCSSAIERSSRRMSSCLLFTSSYRLLRSRSPIITDTVLNRSPFSILASTSASSICTPAERNCRPSTHSQIFRYLEMAFSHCCL